ncbi:MAG TPA: DoxX family protein [Candidatus Acidoferrum sp.]|nr:DoxX family protein [Candidatus Acidoferrum sp.]
MRVLIPSVGARASLALLLLRVLVGLALIQHGAPKIRDPLHWLDNGPLPGTPIALQLIVAIAEFVGGFAMILGFLTPLFSLLLVCDMMVVVFVVMIPHGAPFVGGPHAFEVPAFILAAVLGLLIAGPGQFSVDGMMVARSEKTRLDWRMR